MRINFRKELLEPVERGAKTTTIRTWPASWKNRVRPGQDVWLAFGRRDRPVLRRAKIEAVQTFDLAPAIRWLRILQRSHSRVRRRLADRKLVAFFRNNATLREALARSIPTTDEREVFETFLAALDELLEKRRTLLFAISFRVQALNP